MLKCQMILFIHNGTYSFSRIIQAKGRETQKYMSLIHSVESAKVQKRKIRYQEYKPCQERGRRTKGTGTLVSNKQNESDVDG